MKGQKSVLVFILALASLIGIGVVLATGFFKTKPQLPPKTDEPKVLGEEVASNPTPTSTIPVSSTIDVNKIVAGTVQSSKEAAAQKVSEVQKTIVNTVEKEISNFTQSQVESMKLQICRDWGVITLTPTITP